MMKNLISVLIVLGLVYVPLSHAQLALDKEITPDKALIFTLYAPRSQIESYVNNHGADYASLDGTVIDKPRLINMNESQTQYAWLFRNKDIFYSDIKAFRTDTVPPPACQPDASADIKLERSECHTAIYQFKQCHLFILNRSNKLIATQPLHIPQPSFLKGKPSCFDVYAMSPAKVVRDGMLIVAGYYDSQWTCNLGQVCATNDPVAFPDPLYKTAFLVRFDKDASGKLVLSQDDKCMPPLNNYDTIDKARKALKDAGCK